MRLGFSLATAKRPDVLIIDEALSVGDARFQQNCLKRLKGFLEAGSSLLLVSHDLSQVTAFCSRVILLERGSIYFEGDTKTGIEKYMQLMALPSSQDSSSLALKESKIYDLKVGFAKKGSAIPPLLTTNDEIELEIEFRSRINVEQLTIGFHIDDAFGNRLFGTNSFHLGFKDRTLVEGKLCRFAFRFPVLLNTGKFTLGISIHKGEAHTEGSLFWSESLLSFEVERISLPRSVGTLYFPVLGEFKE